MRLAVLRHGLTSWNLEKRLQGRADIPLSEQGRELLRQYRLPSELQDWQWISSPLQRAYQTAEILGVVSVRIEPRLIEMDFGAWEGLTIVQARAEAAARGDTSDYGGLDRKAEGGESYREVQARLRPWLLELAKENLDTVAVTHKSVITALYAMAVGWDISSKPKDKLVYDRLQFFELFEDGTLRCTSLNQPLVGVMGESAW